MGLDVERRTTTEGDAPRGAPSRRPARTTRRRCRRPAAGCRRERTRWPSGSRAPGPARRRGRRCRAPRGAVRASRWHGPGRPRPGRGGWRSTTPGAVGRRARRDGRRARGRATSKPRSAPMLREQRHVALALVPEVEVLAHDRRPWPRGTPTRTSRTKSSAGSFERSSSKGITRHRSRPVSASSSSFWSRSVSSRGADSGRTTAAGWRSKVTTALASPAARRPAPHLGDHRLVAEVHAVVGADRDDAARRRGGGPRRRGAPASVRG